jgi:hypothetical protein
MSQTAKMRSDVLLRGMFDTRIADSQSAVLSNRLRHVGRQRDIWSRNSTICRRLLRRLVIRRISILEQRWKLGRSTPQNARYQLFDLFSGCEVGECLAVVPLDLQIVNVELFVKGGTSGLTVREAVAGVSTDSEPPFLSKEAPSEE